MSGARALASARRRRAEPQNNVAPSSSSSTRIANNTTTLQQDREQEKPKMSPAMMLLSHNKIIENLQTIIGNLNSKVEEQEQKLNKLMKEKSQTSQMDNTNIEYYKKRIATIDDSLDEIKQHTLKVQTFSMDTNLQMVEVKKKLNKYEKKEQDNEAKQREKIIEHINKVSIILTRINYEISQGKDAQNIQNNTLVDILQGMSNNVTGETVVESIKKAEGPEVENDDGSDGGEDEDVEGPLVENADGGDGGEDEDVEGPLVENADGGDGGEDEVENNQGGDGGEDNGIEEHEIESDDEGEDSKKKNFKD